MLVLIPISNAGLINIIDIVKNYTDLTLQIIDDEMLDVLIREICLVCDIYIQADN